MILFRAALPISNVVARVASTFLGAMVEGQADEIVREDAFEAVRAVLQAFVLPPDAQLVWTDDDFDQDGTLLVKWQDTTGATQNLFIDEAGVVHIGE